MGRQIFKKVKVRMQSALATAKTITAISKAAEAVITCTHDYAIGDFVVLDGIVGMVELNGKVIRVKSVTGTTSFVAEGIDSTNDTTYVSGGTAQKVSSFVAFDNVTNLSLPDSPPTELDATTVHDIEKQVDYGLRDYPKATFNTLADPLATTSVEMAKAEEANTRRVFIVELVSGYVGIYNAYVSGGSGLDGSSGGLATATVSMTLRNKTQWFAS